MEVKWQKPAWQQRDNLLVGRSLFNRNQLVTNRQSTCWAKLTQKTSSVTTEYCFDNMQADNMLQLVQVFN